MPFTVRFSLAIRLFPLLVGVLVSACGFPPQRTGGATASMTNVIQPCARSFYPATTLNHPATQASTESIYFLSGVHLYALNGGNGALRWCLLISNVQSGLSQVGPVIRGHVLGIPPPLDGLVGLAVQKDRVFVTSMNFMTYAFATDSGKTIWQQNTGVANGVPVISGDTLYVPSGAIYALSAHDGSQRWSHPTTDVVTSAPVIVDQTLYTGSYDNAVYALDTANGSTRWTYHTGGRVSIAPIVDHGVVYAGSGDDGQRILAIDAASGKLLWQTASTFDTATQLAMADGMLYTTGNNNLVGLNPRNGKVLWQYGGLQNASLLVDGHRLYVASAAGTLYAFDTQTHAILWHEALTTLGAGEVSRLKLIGDELYVGFNDLGGNQLASIHAINTRTGNEDWSASAHWNVSTLDLA